jgi:trehalose 6-phosphate synthase/phosphatase
MSKTIIVSNRLPVRVENSDSGFNFITSEGGLATGLGSIYKQGNNLWLGWPGITLENQEDESEISSGLEKNNMHAVFLTEYDIEAYYEGFSNETLWPNFHYFNQYTEYNEEHWEAYQAVNKKFADEVLKVFNPEDTVWIHDYQLLLLPSLIREKHPLAKIGFFLHIPFPSYESFRRLPWRRELLHGMLGADFVGFHTYDDMRHFMSSVSRLAGFNGENGQISFENRKVLADALPMGIDYNKYASLATQPETIEREERYRKTIGNQKLLLSIDRLDYSKGIPQRLIAFGDFLEKYPEYKGNVSLFMIVVPSRDNVGKYKELKENIDLLVGKINGKYSKVDWQPIHYFYRSFPPNALSAFYRMADVALVTPLRDGMNLVCKEFIASKFDKKGVLILSEMVGASKELSDAILINPNSNSEIVNAIYEALNMPLEEQNRRMEVMQTSLQRYNIHQWVRLFMDRLDFIKNEQAKLQTKIWESHIEKSVKEAYDKSTNRMLLLDYDGTLVPFFGNPEDAKPDEKLEQILQDLTEDDKNRVVIISGRDRKTLHNWLEPYPVDLIAEHGVYLREHGSNWDTIDDLDDSWKPAILELLEDYVNRTPGSFVEQKQYSLVWHYRKVELGLGEMRTRELSSHLKYLSTNQNLHVLEGDMVVEIKVSQINKGSGAKSWIEKFNPDFILSIGDDWTDEDMFKALPESAYSIKVGSMHSAAKYSVTNYKQVRDILSNLSWS